MATPSFPPRVLYNSLLPEGVLTSSEGEQHYEIVRRWFSFTWRSASTRVAASLPA